MQIFYSVKAEMLRNCVKYLLTVTHAQGLVQTVNNKTTSSDGDPYPQCLPINMTQQIGSKLYHCDSNGLVQVVEEQADVWCARNMDRMEMDHVEFVCVGYQEAKRLAREQFGTGNVVAWRK